MERLDLRHTASRTVSRCTNLAPELHMESIKNHLKNHLPVLPGIRVSWTLTGGCDNSNQIRSTKGVSNMSAIGYEQGIIGNTPKTKQVEELYVAAFKVPVGEGAFAEMIMSGIYADGEMMFARSSVEHDPNAVPSLIRFCKEIEEERGLSWRLLKFDREGVHELDKGLYEEYQNWFEARNLM